MMIMGSSIREVSTEEGLGWGVRGGLLQTEETKSSYYCLCLLLRWQKYEQCLCVAQFPTSPHPHHPRLHFVLLLRITSSPPARPQHGFNMHFFIIYMDSKRILSIIATRRKQVIYIYIYSMWIQITL
jgi:hypothetical protein